MDTYQLRYLECVLRHGHIGRAAEELNVTQPAVTHGIKRLEEKLGVELIRRTPQGVFPSEYGKALYAHAQAALNSIKDGEDEIRALQTGGIGSVTLGVTPLMNSAVVSGLLQRVFQEHPTLRLTVLEGSLSEHLDRIFNRTVDFVFGLIQPDFTNSELVCERLIRDNMFIYARVKHPIFDNPKVALRDLAKHDWAVYRAERISELFRIWFRVRNSDVPAIALRTSSPDFLRAAVVDTDLVALLPEHFAGDLAADGEIRRVDVEDLALTLDSGLIYHQGAKFTRAKAYVCDVIRQVAAAHATQS